jgi:hypothetical protein
VVVVRACGGQFCALSRWSACGWSACGWSGLVVRACGAGGGAGRLSRCLGLFGAVLGLVGLFWSGFGRALIFCFVYFAFFGAF